MKLSIKFKIFFIITFIIFFLAGCQNPKYINLSNKPSLYYHSETLLKLTKSYDYTLNILNNNYYSELNINDDDKNILTNFLNSLTTESFIAKPTDLPKKPMYKIFITCNNNKFIINIYNNSVISLFPWDSNYNEDYISLENIPKRYNLLGYCKYIFNDN